MQGACEGRRTLGGWRRVQTISIDGYCLKPASNRTYVRTERQPLSTLLTLGFRRSWRHNGAMPSVQIKDVPKETHAILRQRAAASHQSLQEYLLTRLIDEASRPTLEEVLDRAAGRAGGSVPLRAAARTLRAERARR